MYKILFFGTSEFAVPSLEAFIHDARFQILGVVTQPDRPVGRHAQMTPSAVKRFVVGAQHAAPLQDVPIKQPEKLQDEPFASWIREIGQTCDAFVVVSYGKILPQWLLDLPKHGVVNVHPSLLPRWRGTSPIHAAIAAGDAVTGVTIMKMDALMDHGPILAQQEETIRPDDTGKSLHDRLAELGAQILPETLSSYVAGNLEPTEQDHAQATHCTLLTRDDGRLDFTKTATELERLIRAYDPWPGTWTLFDGKRLKILAAHVGSRNMTKQPGEQFVHDGIPSITCANGTTLVIERMQLEGADAMNGVEFLRGHIW